MRILILLLSLFASINLYAKNLTVGATTIPHAEILEFVAPILKKNHDINLKIVEFQDYILPNVSLNAKSLDANFFQHVVYLNSMNKEHKYNFVNAGEVFIAPIGVYSKNYKSIKDVKEGATVLYNNSVADRGRVLKLLEKSGLITLNKKKSQVELDLSDITSNPKKLNFKNPIDAALLPSAYYNNEADLLIINTNYALEAKLNPTKDAIAIEDSSSPYVNVVAVRSEDANNPDIKKLVEVLQSKEVKDFMITKYKGSIVPVK